MESSLGLKWVPIRSDMEWAAESFCVPVSSERFGLGEGAARGWGCWSDRESVSLCLECGRMAEDVSEKAPSCLRPFIFSLSLENGDLGLSRIDKSNILAVMLFRMNWMLTWILPRSFLFLPGRESSVYQLTRERDRKYKTIFFNKTSEIMKGRSQKINKNVTLMDCDATYFSMNFIYLLIDSSHLLLFTEFIFCKNPKFSGKICFCWGNRGDANLLDFYWTFPVSNFPVNTISAQNQVY